MRRASGLITAIVLTLAVGSGAFARDASADEKGICSAKYQSAQRFRAAGKLTLARGDLLKCAEPACPTFVSNDCKTWLAEVETDLPTLVFAVLDSTGGDIPNAVIRVDGADVPSATDGLGHAVDPGEHVVETYAGGHSLRQQIVVRVGEKSRRVELRLATAPPPVAAESTGSPAPATSSSGGGAPVGVYVLGGVGLAAIVAGSALWVAGSNAAKSYNADCESTGCTSGQHDYVERQLVAGDVAWGVGLVAGIVAVTVALSMHGGTTTTAVSIGPGGVGVAGRF
jgi:hypothetical protein